MASGVQTKILQLVNGIPTMVPISYVHDQASSNTTWTISHSLGKQDCNIEFSDSSNFRIYPSTVSFDSSSQITATFDVATAGKAVVNI